MTDIYIHDGENCFVCGEIVGENIKSALDSTNFSQKPIYKFVGELKSN